MKDNTEVSVYSESINDLLGQLRTSTIRMDKEGTFYIGIVKEKCPFCGNVVKVDFFRDSDNRTLAAECNVCNAQVINEAWIH